MWCKASLKYAAKCSLPENRGDCLTSVLGEGKKIFGEREHWLQ